MTNAHNEDKVRNDHKRTALRNYIVHAVDALQPLRDGQHHNSFFKLDGDEALDYDTVVEYIISDLAEAEPISLNTCTIINEDDVDVASDDDNDGAALNESTDELTDKQKQEARKRKKSIRSADAMKKRKLSVGFHHNKLNALPPDFVFPSMVVPQFISCYLVGDVEKNIPPLGTLSSADVMHFKSKKGKSIGNKVRGKMKPFMKIVEKYAREKGVWIKNKLDWTPALVTKMWDAISDEFAANFCKSKRPYELAWTACYDNMSKVNAFNNPRNKLEKARRLDIAKQQQEAE